MSELLNDIVNLDILENICFGTGVEVNYSYLSKIFQKHRNTIKTKVRELRDNKIIDRPVYPFLWLYNEYPLLVIARADLPRTEKIDRFLKTDENIFAAFYVRDEEYNTILIEYHKDLYSYNLWKKRIVAEDIIPPREGRYPAHSLFFSTKDIIKYNPYSPIYKFEQKMKEGKELVINNYKFNTLSFQIMKKLMMGEGIRTNQNILAQKLGLHRKTIERRISVMIKENIIAKPACRFPRFFVPPNNILVYSLVEVKKSIEKVKKEIRLDAHIPVAIEAMIGRYNLLIFGVFENVEDHFEWVERYDTIYSGCLGAMKNTYLSPKMTASIDQQDVSMGIIRQRKEYLRGKELIDSVKME